MPKIVVELALGQVKALSCPEYSQLEIVAAGYFNNTLIEPGSLGFCPELNITDFFSNVCDGQNGCEIQFSREDPCANESTRLVVVYGCGQPINVRKIISKSRKIIQVVTFPNQF